MLRMAYLTEIEAVEVGIMCASSEVERFVTTFEQLKISQIFTKLKSKL